MAYYARLSRTTIAYLFAAVSLVSGLRILSSIKNMINFTSFASAAFHMPKVGLGTLGITPSEAKPVINEALSMGYRLFDCAPVYFNEKELGDAFHETTSGVPRTDVFITSKLASPFHRPEHVGPALRKTLNGEFAQDEQYEHNDVVHCVNFIHNFLHHVYFLCAEKT
jgi:predicted aldo/keto reductase-like oxidoreductase